MNKESQFYEIKKLLLKEWLRDSKGESHINRE
jgi:hypothetical protein